MSKIAGPVADLVDAHLSRAVENGILQEVLRRTDEAWLAQNRGAIEAYNQRIECDGLFADEHRTF